MMKPKQREGQTTSQRFEEFDRANPHVFETLVRLARQLRAEGFEKVAIDLVYNQARWQLRMRTTTEGKGWKLNDHYRAYYARKVMSECPDLADVFDLRKSEADAWSEERYGIFGAAA